MSTQTKVTRTVKKLEVPRPLKSSSNCIQTRSSVLDLKISTVDDLIVLTQTVACEISLGNYDRYFQANVSLMYSHLKTHGAQLETMYKDLLDKFFILFRNGSQDESLDKKSRLHLLELIELRAKNWQENDNMTHYYKHRVTHAEPSLMAAADLMSGVDVLSIPLGSPPPPVTTGSNNNMQSAVTEPAPSLLGPGEIIKPSGKFPKPTKIPGKNYSKDEVVIRNADSGKVMGIKGRRVHMIEELSDTIISFQRVSPGAKERLVQITGPNEENVNHAKHLIGDTIRRNASPVRLEGVANVPLRSSNSSLNSSGSDDANPTLVHSMSCNDMLGEFRYTVAVGPNNYIKLIGNNLHILNEAKVLLDERFENFTESDTPAGEIGDFFRIGNKLSVCTNQDESNGNNSLSNGLSSPTDDDYFFKNSSEESNSEMSRRMRFSRSLSSSDKKPVGRSVTKLNYSLETLLHLAASPLSKVAPRAEIPPEMARKGILQLEETYLTNRKRSEEKQIENSPEKEAST